MRGVDAFEVLRHLVKSLIPADAFPAGSGAPDRMPEPVFVVVDVLQGDGLWADVPLAERVILVTADVQTFSGQNGDFDAAHSFAEIAVAIVNWSFAVGVHGGKVWSELSIAGFAAP